MIEINRISKSFNGKEIINDISAKFEKGQPSLIIGASGTGKSVLLKCIVGLIKADSGDVFYDGRDFANGDRNIKTEIRREIGMLFQGGALFDSKNVEQNVMFPLNILTKMSYEEKIERVNFCLKRVSLENVNKKMPSEISGGMKKRVGIARAIVNNPKYLFCDEPNSGLDPKTAIVIDNLIQEITREYNITTVINSHDMNSVMEIGEKIVFLKDGYKEWEGSKKTIFRTDNEAVTDFVYSSNLFKKVRKMYLKEDKDSR
jgi:phospholipid/cholesterol/gamma-HCH transport system ATP-binding protein